MISITEEVAGRRLRALRLELARMLGLEASGAGRVDDAVIAKVKAEIRAFTAIIDAGGISIPTPATVAHIATLEAA